MSVQSTYAVTGMTCAHCVAAVSTELGKVPGVEEVAVDLTGGLVELTSAVPVPVQAVREAVEEAGYALTEVDAR